VTALFEADGDRFVATEMSRGPWDPASCHGGPVSALLARAVEQVGPVGAWQLARLTVELTRPVPVGKPLTLGATVERPGKKVSLVAALLCDGDVEVARARVLRIRLGDVELPDDAHLAADTPLSSYADLDDVPTTWATTTGTAFHTDACVHRFAEGEWDVPGPVGVWIRLAVPVVDGEEPSGVQRVAAAADFGNGVSASLDHDQYLFINPDLTIHLLRPPSGEWVGMRTASRYATSGAGLAESELFDADGRIGRSCQSLFVDHR